MLKIYTLRIFYVSTLCRNFKVGDQKKEQLLKVITPVNWRKKLKRGRGEDSYFHYKRFFTF